MEREMKTEQQIQEKLKENLNKFYLLSSMEGLTYSSVIEKHEAEARVRLLEWVLKD
jgi:hypothetical protein